MSLFRRYRPEDYEFWDLATYNAERHRGIMHTLEYQEKMAKEQARFDAKMKLSPETRDSAKVTRY